jgi:hypothetical protein
MLVLLFVLAALMGILSFAGFLSLESFLIAAAVAALIFWICACVSATRHRRSAGRSGG